MSFALFNKQTEVVWKSKDDHMQDELSEILEKYPETNHEEIVDSYSWDLHLNQQKYPSLHRESLIITIFNFLEHELNSLCEKLYESTDSSLKLRDINGKGVERAQLFLTKVAKIDFSAFGSELSVIKGVNLVRNLIVHNGGLLSGNSDAKVNKFVSSSEHLFGSERHCIIIGADFIGFFIEVLLSFFERLGEEVQKHMLAHANA